MSHICDIVLIDWRELTAAVQISQYVAKKKFTSHTVPNSDELLTNAKIKKFLAQINAAYSIHLPKSKDTRTQYKSEDILKFR